MILLWNGPPTTINNKPLLTKRVGAADNIYMQSPWRYPLKFILTQRDILGRLCIWFAPDSYNVSRNVPVFIVSEQNVMLEESGYILLLKWYLDSINIPVSLEMSIHGHRINVFFPICAAMFYNRDHIRFYKFILCKRCRQNKARLHCIRIHE